MILFYLRSEWKKKLLTGARWWAWWLPYTVPQYTTPRKSGFFHSYLFFCVLPLGVIARILIWGYKWPFLSLFIVICKRHVSIHSSWTKFWKRFIICKEIKGFQSRNRGHRSFFCKSFSATLWGNSCLPLPQDGLNVLLNFFLYYYPCF